MSETTSPTPDNALSPATEAETLSLTALDAQATAAPIGEPEPGPESAPVSEPAPEPEPLTEPDPEPEPDPTPEPLPEPLPNEEVPAKIEAAQESITEPAVSLAAEQVTEQAAAPVAEPVAVAAPKPAVVPEAEPEPVEPEESFADIFSEFQRTNSRRSAEAGSQIRGTIVAVTADSVLVDIGFKSEGILPVTAFPANREAPKAGDTVQVSVKGRDEDGYYQLSLFKTAQPKDWTSLEKAFADKSTIVGTVTAAIKGGLRVDVGVQAFLPASRSGARDAAEMEKLVGEEIRCRITKLDVQDEDVVVDRRIVTEEEALETKSRRYAEVAEGAVVDGTVSSLTDYGAFVDLGGIDGLLHISDIAWTRIANAADVLTVGQQLEVKVLKIDPEGKRISLGLKQLQPHPWDAVAEKFTLGDKVRGVVTRTADFGAFVEIAPGVEGLVHLSEMSYTKRILKATEVVKVGDVVDAVILSIQLAEKRIGLGLKQALGDPWVDAAKRLTPGSVIEGPVASMTKFGAFVQAAEGVEGLVHISEIVVDRRLNHPSDVLRVGQVVKAMVLELDQEKRQLRLSMKQLIPTSMDEFLTEHVVGDIVTGRVASVTEGVAQVELGEGIHCSCKLPAVKATEPEPVVAAAGKVDLSAFSSMLKTKWKTGNAASSGKKPADEAVGAGQVRRFRITAIDTAAKSVGLELVS